MSKYPDGMMDVFPGPHVWTIAEKSNNSSFMAIENSDDGSVAFLLFTSEESGMRYLKLLDQDKWDLAQFLVPDAADWMRDSLVNQRATELAVDPDPENDDVKIFSILDCLVSLEE